VPAVCLLNHFWGAGICQGREDLLEMGPMKSFVRGLVVLIILAGAGFAGVVYLAQSTAPTSSSVEKTIANDTFPR
jgi:phage shock protein PspC (stress-responsive transcriptional regulator)